MISLHGLAPEDLSWMEGGKVRDPGNEVVLRQELITWSLHLPYKPYETTFARIFLFLETRGGY